MKKVRIELEKVIAFDDFVFVFRNGKKVYAYDAKTGKLREIGEIRRAVPKPALPAP